MIECKMSGFVEIFVPVPRECMGIVIGTRGRNINQIKERTRTRITCCNGDKSGKGFGFTVTGAETNVEEARLAIIKRASNNRPQSLRNLKCTVSILYNAIIYGFCWNFESRIEM